MKMLIMAAKDEEGQWMQPQLMPAKKMIGRGEENQIGAQPGTSTGVVTQQQQQQPMMGATVAATAISAQAVLPSIIDIASINMVENDTPQQIHTQHESAAVANTEMESIPSSSNNEVPDSALPAQRRPGSAISQVLRDITNISKIN